MDHEQTRQVIEKYLTTMVERGDYGSYFSDDVELTVVGTDQGAHGRAEVEGLIHAMHTQAFDAKPELRSLVVGAGMAVIEAVFAAPTKATSPGWQPPADRSASRTQWSTTSTPERSRRFASTVLLRASWSSSPATADERTPSTRVHRLSSTCALEPTFLSPAE